VRHRVLGNKLLNILHINVVLSPWRPGFDLSSLHVGFVVDKVALGQVFFSPEYFGFALSIKLHRCSVTRRNRRKVIVFITRLHSKPLGCGASVSIGCGAL
jgi:hypothetical protein